MTKVGCLSAGQVLEEVDDIAVGISKPDRATSPRLCSGHLNYRDVHALQPLVFVVYVLNLEFDRETAVPVVLHRAGSHLFHARFGEDGENGACRLKLDVDIVSLRLYVQSPLVEFPQSLDISGYEADPIKSHQVLFLQQAPRRYSRSPWLSAQHLLYSGALRSVKPK